MTTLDQRPNTALIVIDVQNGVMKSAYGRDAVVANIASLVEKARGADVPVVWVQHESEEFPKGTETWQIVPELFFELIGDPDPVKSEAAMAAMLTMSKLDCAALRAAVDNA